MTFADSAAETKKVTDLSIWLAFAGTLATMAGGLFGVFWKTSADMRRWRIENAMNVRGARKESERLYRTSLAESEAKFRDDLTSHMQIANRMIAEQLATIKTLSERQLRSDDTMRDMQARIQRAEQHVSDCDRELTKVKHEAEQLRAFIERGGTGNVGQV